MTHHPPSPFPHPQSYRGQLGNALALALLWLLLTGGQVDAWLVGIPTVIAATWAVGRLYPTAVTSLNPAGLLRFIPLFVTESLRGGLDVVERTLRPAMRIAPGFVDFETRLATTPARVFFANCVSLLPGTLVADLDEQRMTLHLLDARLDPEPELRRIEGAVARIFPQPASAGLG